MTLEELYKIIEDRKKNLPENSYVASLFKKGKDRIIQKVGEETIEVLIAAKNGKKEAIIFEVSDLIFHLLILISLFKITPSDILKQLTKRRTQIKSSDLP